MTTVPPPGHGAPQQDTGWAFTPRRPVGAGPVREPRPWVPPSMPPEAPAEPGPGPVPGSAAEFASGAAHRTAPRSAPGPVPADDGQPPTAQSPRAPQVPPTGQPQPRRTKGARTGRVLAALAVAAAAVGAFAALKQADTAPVAAKELAQVWRIPAPAADDQLIGSWLTGSRLIRASTRGGIGAYSLADGSEVWHTAPPAGNGTVPCAMSPAIGAQGIGTVAFGRDGNSCTSLAGIDTATGKILWTVPLVDAGHPTAMAAQTSARGEVATIVSENFLGGLDLRTGRRIWGYQPRGTYCNVYDWGADKVVLVDDYCADSAVKFTLTAYDGQTGKVIWTARQGAHTDVAHIFSGSPLIASIHTAVEDSVRVFTPSGGSRKLAVGNTEPSPGNGSAADRSARLVGTTLVTPAKSAAGSEIDGYDTATGAKLWTYSSAALAIGPPGDDRVYAVSTSGPPQLLRLDPRTGRATPLARLPVPGGRQAFAAGTVYLTPGGGVLELDALGTAGGVRLYR